ncbi:MAG: nitrite/sulfite reductase [Planctomycetota bacterium]
MARTKAPEPIFQTPEADLNKVEVFKRDSQGVVGPLPETVRDLSDLSIGEESEQLAKSHGIYLEYNRAQTGREKDWLYMVRITCPGGGSFNAEQWRTLDEISDRYCTHEPNGRTSIRLTTRQNIQYHWLKKPDLINLVQDVASTGYYTLNGCGDNVRNVMGCPLSKFSPVCDANKLAHEYGAYFRLPAAPHIQVFAVDPAHIEDPEQQYSYGRQLLNRKFKIAFASVTRHADGRLIGDNCVEARSCEIGVAPVLAHGIEEVEAYEIFIGGGQGEKNGKPTFAGIALPFARVAPEDLFPAMKAIVDVHKQWGDRKNRVWARMKYVVQKQGIPWFQNEVKALGVDFEQPDPDFDIGPRMMHHGWHHLETTGKLAYGAYIENGRLIDTDPASGNGHQKSMVLPLLEKFGAEVLITANQDLLFTGIDPEAKQDFEATLAEHGYGKRKGKAFSQLRVLSGACVGLPTCRLAYTDSEQWEPELIDALDELGYGDVHESIGITGCERQCFRPGLKTIGWVGQGPDQYALKLGGSEDGRYQGQWITGIDPAKPDKGEQWLLRRVSKADAVIVTAALFDYCKANRQDGEDMGATIRRLGQAVIVEHLRSIEAIAPLLKKTFPQPFQPYDESGQPRA